MEMPLRGMEHLLADRHDTKTPIRVERENTRENFSVDVHAPPVTEEQVPLTSTEDLHNRLAESGLASPMVHEIISTPALTQPPERNMADVSAILHVDTPPRRAGILQRLASSRTAKTLYALGALFGLGGKAVSATGEFREASAQQEHAHETMRDLAMTSSFTMAERYGVVSLDLPTANDVISFSNGETMTRGELIGKIDVWYTSLIITEHGPMGLMTDQCSTTLPDGSPGLDALKCNDIYDDQVQLDAHALTILAEVHGYTQDQIVTHGKIIRGSIMQRPSGIVMPGSTLGMTYFDLPNLSEAFDGARASIYNGYYTDASRIAFTAIRGLDVRSTDLPAIHAIQSTIQTEIILSNATMYVAADMLHIENAYASAALMTGLHDNQTGQHFASHIDKLHAAQDDAELAWKTLSAHETVHTGPLHAMERALTDVHGVKIDTLMRAGRDAGSHVDFFLSQIERFSPSHHS